MYFIRQFLKAWRAEIDRRRYADWLTEQEEEVDSWAPGQLQQRIAMDESDLPEGAVVLNVLHVVEYMDPDNEGIYKADYSHESDGSQLGMGKALELIEWARAFTISEMIADMVHDYVFGGEEGEEDVEVE